ncbi:Phosphate starvation-inducible ATPase PhoH with RNA binding motif [Methylophaga frappieri]|uniref:PhoH-like protein n=1 Tax=Methylophaga frappieri (strain ATCC BAA-2434 / DSM 25690 / JAM7) TaxID=754477 RepID=I1YJ46_METFJ|nr:PhoH family protein [Methylophaga frappieri]AFJ02939.1 Phosphate starvation-inducible ATPase PhoH with RNA binding motif [Methylophaga frappieri]
MSDSISSVDSIGFELSPADNPRLANLCGHLDEHLRMMERGFGVEINNRGGKFQIIGHPDKLADIQDVIHRLYAETAQNALTPEQVHLAIRETGGDDSTGFEPEKEVTIKTKRGLVKARGENQQAYLRRIITHDINFGIGPAGTGKTYLAVACAVEALERDFARRIVLVRPAVEAGERLGFLPGDLAQKVDPYLRPLFDALYEMLGFERVAKLIERNVIEVAPLAYMRGRTLNEAFIILDEAQNTTCEQMKMFLTRLGYNSTAVITGDITQIDLPVAQRSGLRHAIEVLKEVEGIGFTFFQAKDVVRHSLVQKVILAYDKAEQKR